VPGDAGFDLIPETLTVTTGTGGTLTSSPTGINCHNGTCSNDFGYGALVTLTATPDVGHRLAAWAGACSGVPITTPTCTVTMDQAQSVTTRFALQQFKLNLSFLGDTTGTISDGTTTYLTDTAVTVSYGQTLNLTATATNGMFWTWGGACAAQGQTPTCSITISGDTNVSAEFDQTGYRYTVRPKTADPSMWLGFYVTYPQNTTTTGECASTASGGACSGSLPRGTTVNLVAHLSPLSPMGWHTFPSWTTGICESITNTTTTSTCTFTLLSQVDISVVGDAHQGP
jgi:hypothetical protein